MGDDNERAKNGDNGNADPFDFSQLEEDNVNKNFVIAPDTTVDEIEANVGEYLKNDLALESNLLTYVLKKRLDESPKRLKEVLTADGVKEKLFVLGDDRIRELVERVRNLETCETENFIFMLPKDKWKEGKVDIPDDPEGRFIASKNLTAVVKQPILDRDRVIYSRDDVGKEVSFFCWDKDLLKAKRTLLEPNGYTIPEWSPIIDEIGDEIGSFPMMGSVGYRIDDDNEFSLWEEKLGLDCPGYRFLGGDEVRGIGKEGNFWSDEVDDKQEILKFEKRYIYVSDEDSGEMLSSVRCISCEKTSPDNYEEDGDNNEIPEDDEEDNSVEVVGEKKKDTMESLREQKWWKQTLSDFSDVVKRDLNDKDREGYRTPIWVSRLRQYIHNGPFTYMYSIVPITNDKYNSSRSEELARPDEKRFIIERNFDYAREMGRPGVKKNVGGFNLSWNPSFGDERVLPEETDFTVENKAENENIPSRINSALYKLFSGFKYSSQEKAFAHIEEKYPDDETLESVLDEFRGIIEDIGDVDEKMKALEVKNREIAKKREEEIAAQELAREISEKLPELAEKVKNGAKLDLEDLKIVYKDEYDENDLANEIRQSLGVDEETMKKMLGY